MRYIGCKTQLLENIKQVVFKHAPNAESFCDIFSGTASVARFFKQWFEVYSNDLLYFSYCLQRGTIECDNIPSFATLKKEIGCANPLVFFNDMDTASMESLPSYKRFFQNNYSPNGGRMYLTDSNALRIDFIRNTIEEWRNNKWINDDEYYYLMASMIEGIPFVSNIAGTYGAFHKFWDARTAKKFILIDLPIVSNKKNNRCYNGDGAQLLKNIHGDVLYVDPPYNERQYLPNYHLLETAAKYDFPNLRGVTGQRPYENQKSDFCSRKKVVMAFEKLVRDANFKHIVLSYNTDGIMTLDEISNVMKTYGVADSFEVNFIPYRRFKSRSDAKNTSKLKEMLIYVKKDI